MKQQFRPNFRRRSVSKVLLLAVALTLTVSCKDEPKSNSEKEAVSNQVNTELQLNQGEKWTANKETQDGVQHMDSIITAFKSQDSKDYKFLGAQLSKETSFIIKNCSMKGEAHDQLHAVLIPMLDKISIMKKFEDVSASEEALAELKALIADYFKHFTLG